MTQAMPKSRIGIYVDDEVLEVMGKLAEQDRRTVPNLAEYLIIEALLKRGLIEFEKIKPIKIDPEKKEGE